MNALRVVWSNLFIADNTEFSVAGRGEWVGFGYPWSGIK